MADNRETVSSVPSYSLSNNLLGSWSGSLNNDFDLYNPDKSDECDPDLILSAPRSDYFSVPILNKVTRLALPSVLGPFAVYLLEFILY